MRCPKCPNEFAHMHRESGMPEEVEEYQTDINGHRPVQDSLLRCDKCGRLWSQGYTEIRLGVFVETIKYAGEVKDNATRRL